MPESATEPAFVAAAEGCSVLRSQWCYISGKHPLTPVRAKARHSVAFASVSEQLGPRNTIGCLQLSDNNSVHMAVVVSSLQHKSFGKLPLVRATDTLRHAT